MQISKWKVYATLGLLLTGFGIAVIGEAVAAKIQMQQWFVLGTLGLVIFNAGLVFFGEAVKLSTLAALAQRKQ